MAVLEYYSFEAAQCNNSIMETAVILLVHGTDTVTLLRGYITKSLP